VASVEVGQLVDRRYELRREIARGGVAAVFEAEHRYTRRAVAVKLLHDKSPRYRDDHTRLLREAQALTLARHPNVVHALDAGETESGVPYLVLELLEGRTLGGMLVVRRRLAPSEVAWLGRELCAALAAVHARGILHRDLKPGNVFVARDETGREVTKLFDFGIAQMPTQEAAADQTLLGTPEYVAPEQLLMRPQIDHRCDLYALGVTLYQCLAGSVPFEGDFADVLLKVKTEPLPLLSDLAPEAPSELCAAVEKALASDPDDRHPTADAFGEALAAVSALLPPPASLLGLRVLSQPPGSTRVALRTTIVPAQRRRFARAPYVTPVRIYCKDAPPLDGRSEDISLGGILVLVPQACRDNERVQIRFALPLTGQVIVVPALGRWVKSSRDTDAVGFEFPALPPDVQALLERFVTGMGVV
jgi:eukaryotic-like serine/threonine-protein kinase